MSFLSTPSRKQDFKVNNMRFWLCEDPTYLLFRSDDWPSTDSISKMKIVHIVSNIGIDEDVYQAFVLHPEEGSEFMYCDSLDENRTILNKWKKCLSKIDEMLLS